MADLNVAIADDNPQTLCLLQDIVEGERGFHVVGKADNGEDAYDRGNESGYCAFGCNYARNGWNLRHGTGQTERFF